jgi:acetyl/propionyl-CoA carboxylase alpha subunit
MNTRLQVEHPVTEAVTGVDLVREMVRVAAGLPVSIPEKGIPPRGHAIEARLYAEDPAKSFMPSPGEITRLEFPNLPNLRVDTGARAGSKVTVYYDPMIAKIIAWGEDRDAAITLMREAIAGTVVEGVKTNLPFLARIFASDDFAAGRISTRYVDEHLNEIMAG